MVPSATADLQTRLQSALGATVAVERELEAPDACRAFLAQERGTGRRLLVKVLPADLGAHPDLDHFRQEIHLSASLEHPHIAPLVGGGTVAGGLYYEMPAVEGETLRACM